MPLKVSFHMNKGFTLIEILISLVILSVILLVTSNILESSLETERNLSNRLEESSSLNLSSIIVKRDIRQIINVPLRDYYGEFLQATIIGDDVQKKISFNSKVNSLSNDSSPIKRIEYLLEDNSLIRKQYFSANPYDSEEYIKLNLLKNITNLEISFMHNKRWHNKWPINKNTENTIPTLIQFEFVQDNKEYTWIIEPNIDYAYKN